MQKTLNNQPHRSRGRPATGRAPVLTLTLPKPLLARVDASADHEFESRTRAIRRLLEVALELERRS